MSRRRCAARPDLLFVSSLFYVWITFGAASRLGYFLFLLPSKPFSCKIASLLFVSIALCAVTTTARRID
jgi:hypothetical protein